MANSFEVMSMLAYAVVYRRFINHVEDSRSAINILGYQRATIFSESVWTLKAIEQGV